jgi:transposase
VLERVAPRIEELLQEWWGRTTAKQRLTGVRLHRQLVEEGYQVGITTVRDYLWEKRRQAAEVYIPLVHRPGEEGQVDFFQVTVDEGECRWEVWKFLLHLSSSGRDFLWLYDRCDQLSFLDGHVRAAEYLGGLPRWLVYDNLTAAVKRLVGVHRELTDRFLALSSYYLFEPCFTRPGEGHDKGSVESRGKGVRLQHLTPIPQGETLEAIATAVLAAVEQSWQGRVRRDGQEPAALWEQERQGLLPLPERPFEVRRLVTTSASRMALVQVEGVVYSVPSTWARLDVDAYVGVTDIRLVCRGEEQVVARERPGGQAGPVPSLPAGAGQEASSGTAGGPGVAGGTGRALQAALVPAGRPVRPQRGGPAASARILGARWWTTVKEWWRPLWRLPCRFQGKTCRSPLH